MRMVDIIEKKRDGGVLTDEEIRFFISGYVDGSIPDYQASALAMAIYFRGMDDHEIAVLTDAMMHSGDIVDLSNIQGIKADKHSTGGVGDKTSLAAGPIVAACGVKMAKMSGRGLGHTGGTLDKLESIPGFRIGLTIEEYENQVNKIGLAIIGQTGEVVPADKKLYALRDVTATVPSVPLIASSIMSKKLAGGSDIILLDVKVGDGAFMKTKEAAMELATKMVAIGKQLGRKVMAVLTKMEEPLGLAVGNSLEVKEAIETLNGRGPADFNELVFDATAKILLAAGKVKTLEEGFEKSKEVVANGSALRKFAEMVEAQGGDPEYIYHPEKFPQSKYDVAILSDRDGYVARIAAHDIGVAAMRLGAGRETMEDTIDPSAGILLCKKVGDFVKAGEPLAHAYTNKENAEEVFAEIGHCFYLAEEEVPVEPIIIASID